MALTNALFAESGGHRFLILYDDNSHAAALQQLSRMAADRTLPQFTWNLAAKMSQSARDLKRQSDQRDSEP